MANDRDALIQLAARLLAAQEKETGAEINTSIRERLAGMRREHLRKTIDTMHIRRGVAEADDDKA